MLRIPPKGQSFMVHHTTGVQEKQFFFFLAITACGFVAAIGQIIILRELMVLFYGNELSTGLIFASWLLWTALASTLGGRYGRRLPRISFLLPLALGVFALLLPASVLWIRAARILWAIPLGEMLGPFSMLWISLAGTGPFCLVSGALFGLTWSRLASILGEGATQPLGIYLAEALGASMGGLIFYFVFLPRTTILKTALFTALIALLAAAFLLGANCLPTHRQSAATEKAPAKFPLLPLSFLAFLIAVVALASAFSESLDRSSRHWQWGPDLLAVRDTPFQNLALLTDAGQSSLFSNGLLLFAAPDPQTSEYAVHPAMLEHPKPAKVLLIGGGVGGLLSEVLKHPQVERVDYVEPDPEVIELAEEFLPGSATSVLLDHRVHLFHSDAGAFIRTSETAFDVIIMHLGNPVNAETNRFYTAEFFTRIAKLLNPEGIFSFAIASSPDMVGPAEARLLRSIEVTLRSVFADVLVIPGESARFLGCRTPGKLTTDPRELTRTIADRKLDLRYVREYYLFDYLNPLRLNYMRSILGRPDSAPVNRDFEPTCYFNNMLVWAAQVHPFLNDVLTALSRVGRPLFWTLTGILAACLLGFFRSSYTTLRQAVMVNVLIVGGVLMVMELILLLGFQILEGFVYTQLALIIAFFMAGMAAGAGIVALLSPRIRNPLRLIVPAQCLISFYVVATLGLLVLLRQQLQILPQEHLPIGAIFSMLAIAGGALGGLHFCLCVQAVSGTPVPSPTAGPKLYALDLVGATGAALIVSLFILPIYGLITTLFTLVLVCTAGVLTLVGRNVG